MKVKLPTDNAIVRNINCNSEYKEAIGMAIHSSKNESSYSVFQKQRRMNHMRTNYGLDPKMSNSPPTFLLIKQAALTDAPGTRRESVSTTAGKRKEGVSELISVSLFKDSLHVGKHTYIFMFKS